MRIGIDARMYGSKVTGIGNYVRHLIDALYPLQTGDEFVLFVQPERMAPAREAYPRYKIVGVNVRWYGWQEQIRLPRILAHARCDVLHFPNFNFPLAYRGKFILTIHDLTPLRFPGPNQKRSAWRRMAYLKLLKAGFRRSAAILAVSRHTADEITRFYPQGADRVRIVYPGLSSEFHGKPNSDIINSAVARYGLRQPYIFYVGVWRDHKNISGLLDAFAILRQRNAGLQLVLAGDSSAADGNTRLRLKNFAPGTVVAPGFVADNDIAALYAGARVTVIPSFNEGFGLTGVESLACGTPVAASETTSVPEVLGEAGRYFSPQDARQMASVIFSLLETDERQKVFAKAPAVIARYRWNETARQTLAAYHQVSASHEKKAYTGAATGR